MELADRAWSRIEGKWYIESGVTSRFYQDQLRQRKYMLIFPQLQVMELQQLSQSLRKNMNSNLVCCCSEISNQI